MQRYGWRLAVVVAGVMACATMAACGSATKQAAATTGGGSPEARSAAPAPTTECSGTCDTKHTCVRAREDQLCGCEVVQQPVSCGGSATRDVSWSAQPRPKQWVCRPLHPQRDRGDGCPFAAPSAQTACTGAHLCQYQTGSCGGSIAQWSCVDNKWTYQQTRNAPVLP